MDEQTKRKRLDELDRLCHDRGLPVTVQRRATLEALLDMDDHPTADQVHNAVTKLITGISRATVYRSLETLVRLGAITRACHLGSAVRYDKRLDIHHHLLCQRCDRIIDISNHDLDSLSIPDTSALGFKVLKFAVQLRGICRRCQEKEGS